MSQQIVIEVDGISQQTVLDIVETHGNMTYCYEAKGDERVEISIDRFEDGYEVNFESDAAFGMMLKHPDLSSAMDHFFDLVKIHPAIEEDSEEIER